jgi:hypothetical protein
VRWVFSKLGAEWETWGQGLGDIKGKDLTDPKSEGCDEIKQRLRCPTLRNWLVIEVFDFKEEFFEK